MQSAAHTLGMFPLFANKLGDIFRFTLSLSMTDKSDFKEKPTQIHTVASSASTSKRDTQTIQTI